jgi:hypothetical protein
MSTPDAPDIHDAHNADFEAAPAVTTDPDRATRLDAALEDAQREERTELANDIARLQATDDRIVAALARTDDAPR